VVQRKAVELANLTGPTLAEVIIDPFLRHAGLSVS
jgi:hypothetical protein